MSEEQAIVVNENVRTLAANIDKELYGYDDVPEVGNNMPSIIKLCQHSTRNKPDGVNIGDFFDSTMGVNYGEELEFYVIQLYTPRIRYTKDYKVDCTARDGLHGFKNGASAGACSNCKHSQWEPEEKLRCNQQVAAVIMIKGGGLPALLMFDKSRLKIGRDLIKKITNFKNQNMLAPQDQRIPLPFYRFKAKSKSTILNDNEIKTIDLFNAGVLDDGNEAELLMSMKKNIKEFIDRINTVQDVDKEEVVEDKTTKEQTNY